MINLTNLKQFKAHSESPSPNFSKRSAKAKGIRWIIIHATADAGNERGSLDWMRQSGTNVSAHLMIKRSGQVVRLVRDSLNAWHAGESSWEDVKESVNSHTLGWEFSNRNDGRETYTFAQYAAAAHLAAFYLRQENPENPRKNLRKFFLGHSHVSPGRKVDPNRTWDWDRFNRWTGYLLDEKGRMTEVEQRIVDEWK